MQFFFAFILSAISLFLILLVLVQRGRGGGLTGALGGMGGQSAFGTKAGDTFTRVTVVSATIWILCAILAVKLLGTQGGPLGDANAAAPPTAPGAADQGAGAGLEGILPPSGADAGAGGAATTGAGVGAGASAVDGAAGGIGGAVTGDAAAGNATTTTAEADPVAE